ncbi:PaaI family thioesterase [Guptibacillus sedimenti]|uniref:PaaI family thioesterase n=1 Tax=Guptibacillus sedimenti TaxID=3025680 RepID=UPI0023621E85|nr:PaaI family thioesterase [Pseudalkalibacillus sedimenti]
MKDQQLLEFFSEILAEADENEKNSLYSLLEGVLKKQRNEYKTYLAGLMGIKSKLLDENTYESIIPVRDLVHNPLHMVHGGITASLIDIAMGSLVHQSLPSDQAAVTSEMNIHFLSKGDGNELRCRSHIIFKSHTRWVIKANVYRDDGTIVATATGNFIVIPRKV